MTASSLSVAQDLDVLRPGIQAEEQVEELFRQKRLDRRETAHNTFMTRQPMASRPAWKTGKDDPNYVMRAAAGLTGTRDGSISIADLDEDGDQDLLITGRNKNFDPTATVYLGDGQGGFREAGADLIGVEGGSASIADLNGDGNQDLLITGTDKNFEPHAVLWLGDGQGGFTISVPDLTFVYGGSTSIADVNGDGNQDLLITGQDANFNPTATLYLGDGQGGFDEADAGLAGVGRGSSTSIADVNGDGNQDLLITGESAGLVQTATLYLGDGQGGFTEAEANLTGTKDGSTSIADVDGDGNQDLLITGTVTELNLDLTATLYLGDGQGGFTEANADLTGVRYSSTSVADVDEDGNQDLLITGNLGRSVSELNASATLYLGDGQGGFTEADAGLTGTEEGSTSIFDLQGDGDLDLVITGENSLSNGFFPESSARIYVNRQNQSPPNRAPTLARTLSYNRLLAPGVTLRRTVEAGDLDGDLLSVQLASGPSNVSVNNEGNGTAEVTFTPIRSQGGDEVGFSVEASDPSGAAGSFTTSVDVASSVAAFSAGLTGTYFGSSSIADVDGDGNQDLLITGLTFPNPNLMSTLYLGDGEGGFTEAGADLTGVGFGSTSIADVDGDGNQDLLITGEKANLDDIAILYLGDGHGNFAEANAGLTGTEGGSTSIADVDGDDNQDLLITGFGPEGETATLYLGDGQGRFTEADAGLNGVGLGSSTSIAEVDGDGNLDLLISGEEVTTLYLGKGDGSFTEAEAGLAGVSYGSSSIADVDGDDNQDLLITGESEFGLPTATLYLGDGQGGFAEAGAGLAGVGRGSSTSIADVNGDGNQDLLITGESEFGLPTATLYLGDGQGGFAEADAGLAGTFGSSTSITDIDGDEDPDLLLTGLSSASRSASSILYENLFDNPLPVELVGFDVTVDREKIRLNWQTASETGNAGFRVQRCVAGGEDGEEGAWTTVGRVEGSGHTTEPRSYQFTDTHLPYEADRLTYRLKQVDTDGSTSYSKEVTVDRSVTEVQLLGTYPNPAQRQATLRYAIPERQEITIYLYDVLGRRVKTLVDGNREGRQKMQIDVSDLASGVYFLRLRAKNTTKTRRLTVVR